jgi:type VI secretion system secreted protein VgrG
LVIESGTTLSLKVGGNFISLNPGGVFISGSMVMINSGGSAGTGAGASPQTPESPKEADVAVPGKLVLPTRQPPPKPMSFSPAAIAMKQASLSGAPFCDI